MPRDITWCIDICRYWKRSWSPASVFVREASHSNAVEQSGHKDSQLSTRHEGQVSKHRKSYSMMNFLQVIKIGKFTAGMHKILRTIVQLIGELDYFVCQKKFLNRGFHIKSINITTGTICVLITIVMLNSSIVVRSLMLKSSGAIGEMILWV